MNSNAHCTEGNRNDEQATGNKHLRTSPIL